MTLKEHEEYAAKSEHIGCGKVAVQPYLDAVTQLRQCRNILAQIQDGTQEIATEQLAGAMLTVLGEPRLTQ